MNESTDRADVDPRLLRSDVEHRLRLAPETRKELRRLDRISARSGRLSPRAYNLTISHRHRFMWFRVAKVGTRTVLGHLQANDVEVEVGHAMRLRYPVDAFSDYYKFAFVRHPLDRFVSAWRDKVVENNYYRFESDELRRMQRLEAFAEWTAGHDLGDVTTVDQHLVLQSRAIDLTQVDHLGRLETFADDFVAVCRRIGLPEVVTQSHNRSRVDQPTDVSAEVRDRVQELYRLDFQILGYAPD
ncbi:hypothetical protein BH09ACT12_BH09ACT12_37380 [soil metagenome]